MSDAPTTIDEAAPKALRALSLDDIFAIDDRPVHKIDVPEWGGFVFLRELSGAERDKFERAMAKSLSAKDSDDVNFRAALTAMSLCDEAGNRVMGLSDAARLGEKSGSVLNRLAETIDGLSKIQRTQLEEIKKVF